MTASMPDAGRRTADTPDVSQRSFGELMGEVTQDLSTLMRQELELARAEMRGEAVKAGKASGLLVGAGIAAHLVLVFLSVALWWGLSNVMDGGWAGLIVAGIWALIAAVLAIVGRTHLRRMRGLPQTTETVKAIPEAVKPNEGAYR
jgi:Putative Actinobacterial Holin-X, holin superfamily III